MPYVEDENGNHIIDDDGNKIYFSVSYEIDNEPAYIHREMIHIDDDGHINTENRHIVIKDGIDSNHAVSKSQLDSVSYYTNNHIYREIFNQFYDLTETSRFNLNKSALGVVILGILPDLHLGTNRFLSNYDRINGIQLSNMYINLKNDVTQNTSYTIFISLYFSDNITIQFSSNAAAMNGYYPLYSINKINNRLSIHESQHISYHSTITNDFKNKQVMLWICHDSTNNVYKFGISNFNSHVQQIINNVSNLINKRMKGRTGKKTINIPKTNFTWHKLLDVSEIDGVDSLQDVLIQDIYIKRTNRFHNAKSDLVAGQFDNLEFFYDENMEKYYCYFGSHPNSWSMECFFHYVKLPKEIAVDSDSGGEANE